MNASTAFPRLAGKSLPFFLWPFLGFLLAFTPLTLHAHTVITNCNETALQDALSQGGLITFACDGALLLSQTMQVEVNAILDGGEHSITIDGNNQVRLFQIASGVNFTLRDLTLTNGVHIGKDGRDGDQADADGQNAKDGFGGAILNLGGFVTIEKCTFSDNQAFGGNGGNAIYGCLGSNPANGGKGGHARGGAVYNDSGEISITDSVFMRNFAQGGQGGSGAANVGSCYGGEGGPGQYGGNAQGGAIYNLSGLIHLLNTSIIQSDATGGKGGDGGDSGTGTDAEGGIGRDGGHADGGAIANLNGTLLLAHSTLSSNLCQGGSGGIGGDGTSINADGGNSGHGGNARGAAIYTEGGLLRLTNCTVGLCCVMGGNGATGGVATAANAHTGGRGGSGGFANSAGIYAMNCIEASFLNCTIAQNVIALGSAGPGGVSLGTGHDGRDGLAGTGNGLCLYNESSAISLHNTILEATPTNFVNCIGPVLDLGHNLCSDTSVNFSRNSFIQTNPLLTDLQNNGGITEVFALQTNSPAIDAADPNAAPMVDECFHFRSGQPDIGAYEVSTNGIEVSIQSTQDLTEDGLVDGFVELCRSGNVSAPLQVWFATTGTPRSGDDFLLLAPGFTHSMSSITIPSGSSCATMMISGINNGLTTGDLPIEFTIRTGCYIFGTPHTATISLIDDEPPLNLEVVGWDPLDGFTLQLDTSADAEYTFEYTTDFKSWYFLETRPGTDGVIQITDPVTFTDPQRYYRAKAP